MQSHYYTIDGYTLHVLEVGRGPAVLLLHGFAGSADDWRPTGAWLAQRGYRALAVDSLGFGRSDKPGDAPYSLELTANLYAGLLDRLGIGQVTVVAHSMGSKYALTLAVLHPTRVRRMALAAADGFVASAPMSKAGGLPIAGPALLWLGAREAVTRQMLNASFYAPDQFVTAELVERGRAALLGADNRRALTALSRRYDANDLTKTGMRARLGEVRAPTLLIWGDQDRVFPLEPYARMAEREIPGAHLVVLPNCGHFPQIEAARAFRGVLSGFL
jgi:pimeloyl-ACP methyl ester carboxylesterase